MDGLSVIEAPRVRIPNAVSTPIALRLAAAADVPAIARIYNDSLPAPTPAGAPDPAAAGRATLSSRQAPLSEPDARHWIEQHVRNGRPLWVMDNGGKIAGWLSLLGFYDRPNCGCAAEVAVYVGRGWQRRGVGRALLAHALREAPRWNIDRLLAMIWHENAASQALFRASGFGAWGRLPGVVWADGRSIDMLIFGRVLAGAS